MRAAVLLAALAGCGRLGFGGAGEDAPDAAPPAIASLTLASATAASTDFAPVPAATLDLPASPGTTWLFVVSASLDSTTGAEPAAEARYLIDGVERGLGGTQNTAPALGGPWQHFDLIDGTSQPVHIAFELRDVSGGTATMRDLFAAAIPLPAAAVAGMQTGSLDPITTISAVVPERVTSFSFTPTAPGPYLVLGLANASDEPGESDVYLQWRDSAGPLGIDAQLPRRPWQSMLWAWIVSEPVPTTYEVWSYRGGADGSLRYIRWLALPLDAFAGYAAASAPARVETTLMTPQPLASTMSAPSSSAATRWLYLATAAIGEACEGLPQVRRQILFSATGATLPAIEHTTDNCASEITSGLFALLDTAPASASIALASGDGKTVQANDAIVVVLGLP